MGTTVAYGKYTSESVLWVNVKVTRFSRAPNAGAFEVGASLLQ